MQEDFLNELGELALGSRLKRLSEKMLSEAAIIYRQLDIDVEPKWFTLLALLHQKQQITVVEAAESLGLSQPAISQFCLQLVKKGLVELKVCSKDSRRKIISLSSKGNEQVEQMLPLWHAVNMAAKELCTEADNNFYAALCQYEQALTQKSLVTRTLEFYYENQQ